MFNKMQGYSTNVTFEQLSKCGVIMLLKRL